MNINDVAEAAGVSRGSVSNYLNNKKVSDKIKLKIETAIKELNYIPNSSAEIFALRSQSLLYLLFLLSGLRSFQNLLIIYKMNLIVLAIK